MQRESHDAERMETLILTAVGEIFRDQSFSRFLEWAREAIPALLGIDDDELPPEELRRLGALLGIAVWNATPLPEYGYRTRPIPLPAPHQPCLCGSGRRFADCCAQAGELPAMPPELIWELLLDDLPEDAMRVAVQQAAIPDYLLAKVADRWLDADRPGRAAALLEPLFGGPLAAMDGRFEAALDVLCDAYDALDHWKKKQSFLTRVTEQGSRELKAAAWQRLGTMLIDEDRFGEAHAAFEQALRHAPDSPANALLEITLLTAEHRDRLARERARFWHYKLRRAGFAGERILEFLEHAILDPRAALATTHADAMDPRLLGLRDWIGQHRGRELPAYGYDPLPEDYPPPPRQQLRLFSDAQLPLPPGSGEHGPSGALRAPLPIRRLERAWRASFPAAKPFGTELDALDDGAVWDSDGWLRFLGSHPDAADSLDILDDLVMAVHRHPESSLPWLADSLSRPLCERAEAIVRGCLDSTGARRLPWSAEANRPALRLLFRLYLYRAEETDDRAASEVLELLLRVDPRDAHGARADLMNHYLRQREDAKAIALARRFPTDVLADLAYGEVLALYRLGEQEHAARVLNDAVLRLPRIPRFLTRKRVKRPPLSPSGFTPGGDDQAWLYREAMRDVWEAEPGLLAWMKKLTA